MGRVAAVLIWFCFVFPVHAQELSGLLEGLTDLWR